MNRRQVSRSAERLMEGLLISEVTMLKIGEFSRLSQVTFKTLHLVLSTSEITFDLFDLGEKDGEDNELSSRVL
jgi:hypothetical protein